MKPKKKYWRLYGLKLESGKYYVGITSKSIERRYKEHLRGWGAAWTRENPPLQIIYRENLGFITEDEAKLKENLLVSVYIKKYGIDNIRGGDISMTDNLVIRGGMWWRKYDWEALVAVSTLTFILVVLGMLYLFSRK